MMEIKLINFFCISNITSCNWDSKWNSDADQRMLVMRSSILTSWHRVERLKSRCFKNMSPDFPWLKPKNASVFTSASFLVCSLDIIGWVICVVSKLPKMFILIVSKEHLWQALRLFANIWHPSFRPTIISAQKCRTQISPSSAGKHGTLRAHTPYRSASWARVSLGDENIWGLPRLNRNREPKDSPWHAGPVVCMTHMNITPLDHTACLPKH